MFFFLFDSFFRKLFDDFDPSSMAQFTEKKMLSLKVDGCLLLSEPKLRAIVENAKLVLKVSSGYLIREKEWKKGEALSQTRSIKSFIFPCFVSCLM